MLKKNLFTILAFTTALSSPAYSQGLAAQGIEVGSADWLTADASSAVPFEKLETSKRAEVLERVEREIEQIYQPGRQFSRLRYNGTQVSADVEPKIQAAALAFQTSLDKPIIDTNFPTIRGWFIPFDINRDGVDEFVIINDSKRYTIIGRITGDEVKILLMQSWNGLMKQVLFEPTGTKNDFIFNGLQETFAAIYVPEIDMYVSEKGLEALKSESLATALVSQVATREVTLYKTPVDNQGRATSLANYVADTSTSVGHAHVNADWVISNRFNTERGSELSKLNVQTLGETSIDSFFGTIESYKSRETYPLNQTPFVAGVQTRVFVKVEEKQTLKFGLRASPVGLTNPCSAILKVNGKVLKSTEGETLSIQESRTFPKGEFLIESVVMCDPVDVDKIRSQPGSVDVYGAGIRHWHYDPLLRNVDFYITDESGKDLPVYDKNLFDYSDDVSHQAPTTGVVYFSSDKGSVVGDEQKLFYDFSQPFKIIDFDTMDVGSIVDEARASINFNFIPQEAGEHSLNLQTLSNLCFVGTGCVARPHQGTGMYRTYHPASEIIVRDGSRVLAQKSKLLIGSQTPIANSRVAFEVTEDEVGRELSISIELLHNSKGAVEMNSFNDDFIVMDILNQSENSAHFLTDDPLDIQKANSRETGVLMGGSREMDEKGVSPLLTAQITVKPPTSDKFRFFRSSEIAAPFIKPSETLEFKLGRSRDVSDGDTSWLE